MLNPALICAAVFALLNGTPFTVASQHSFKPPFICLLNNLKLIDPANFSLMLPSKSSTLVLINSSQRYCCPSNFAMFAESAFSSACSSLILRTNLLLFSLPANNLLIPSSSFTNPAFLAFNSMLLSTVIESISCCNDSICAFKFSIPSNVTV